ncbi:MAG: type II toxin-antitoxin system RelE/ParE family toxin [Flavobacteriaceae bacterium]|nr:type II toxin-antitoxin system RelE/ParE family toxin [Flavobacteriaceae bacterium]
MKRKRIIWSKFAGKQLDNIFDYYKKRVSLRVSLKIIQSIITDIEKLENNPFIGQHEELLKNRKHEYRSLISKNYKIVYTIDDLNQIIRIYDIFDTRQNPKKIIKNK